MTNRWSSWPSCCDYSASRPACGFLLACLSQPASVGEIAVRANLPRGLASHHLRLLRAGRFLRTTRNGKQMIYEPRDERVFCILADLIGHIVKPPADDDE